MKRKSMLFQRRGQNKFISWDTLCIWWQLFVVTIKHLLITNIIPLVNYFTSNIFVKRTNVVITIMGACTHVPGRRCQVFCTKWICQRQTPTLQKSSSSLAALNSCCDVFRLKLLSTEMWSWHIYVLFKSVIHDM